MSEVTCPGCGIKFAVPGTKFHPPNVGEVASYAAERGYTFSPQAFVAFYESKGWTVGRTPMKSWRAACVTWQEKEDERNPQNSYATARKAAVLKKHLSAAGYEIPETDWVKDLRRRIAAREPWSPAELEAMKRWEAGENVKPPDKPSSWEEVEKGVEDENQRTSG
jgi:hypothetical protein